MAKNRSHEFATMSDDERRQFTLEERDEASDMPRELNFDEPRNADRIGRKYGSLKEEIADRDSRDGASALLDDEAHRRKVDRRRGRQPQRMADRRVNVGTTERVLSSIAGAALTFVALRRGSMRGLLLPVGGGLLWRAITGRCAVNRAFGRNSAKRDTMSPVTSVERGAGIKVEKSILVERTPEETYRFWRNFENLARFMNHLESVTILDEGRSHWIVRGPMGSRVEWDAEIHNELPNELIAWRTLPGSEINHAGSVHFESPLSGRGTNVRVILRYEPPAGKPGAMIASLFGEEPSQQIADDLRRFKEVMEASGPKSEERMQG